MTTIKFKLGGTLEFVDEPEDRPGTIVTLRYDGFQITVKGEHMAYTLSTDHQVQVKVAYVDSKGNPASVDGPVTWVSTDEAIAKVNVDAADSMLATVVPQTRLGQVQISAIADADIGSGVTELRTLMDIDVVGGQAVAGTITPVGEATPIPPG